MTAPEPPKTPETRHVPVMLPRIVELLAPALQATGSIYVDGTLGLGGHAQAVLEAAPEARLIGIDRDRQALEMARKRLQQWASRVQLVHAVYDELPDVLQRLDISQISAVLLDLGVSSLQLDEGQRGFSYSRDAPLDMRMDQSRGITAEDVVNDYEAGELARVLRTYGEERFVRRIVAAIVRERSSARITSTARLAELVREAVPAAARRTGGHPAKRTFQALRIEVNGELRALASTVPSAVEALAPGGRIAVLSYHSLEDRLVKQTFAAAAHPERDAGLPPDLPIPAPAPGLRLLTRGAERPSEEEVAANPRAASAHLRAAERLAAPLPPTFAAAVRAAAGPPSASHFPRGRS